MTNSNLSYAIKEQTKEKTTEAKTAEGIKCPFCGASIHKDDEVCPSCGRRLAPYCTFCGAPMTWSDDECPECGAPAGGIKCPACGALSQRSFCPKCNTPVTRAAVRMVEAAKNDPLFQAATAQNQKAEELAAKIEKAAPEEAPKLKQELIKVTNDLNAILDKMLPPAGGTPQEQRNYFCARKVAVATSVKEKVKVGWVCNYCGCCHNQPSECTKPYLGGTWQYKEISTTRIDYVKK